MEPLSLILSALASGATAVAQKTGGQALSDAYDGLKNLIKKKFEGAPEKETALDQHAATPEVWEAPLKHALQQSNVCDDQKILELAEKLMAALKSEQSGGGGQVLNVNGGTVNGVIQKNDGNATFNFGK